MLKKLKQRWKIESNIQIAVIFVVFAITGFSVLIAKNLIFSAIGVSSDMRWYLRVSIWVVTILPVYYLLLLFYGTLCGQKTFFVWFTKKTLYRLWIFNTKSKTSSVKE